MLFQFEITKQEQLLAFPFNTIGWIQSKCKLSKQSNLNASQGTGFLISESLVLTSSHLFIIQDGANGKIKQIDPISFFIQQPSGKGFVEKIYKIKDLKLNVHYVHLFKKIASLKKSYFQEQDKVLKQEYGKNILELQETSIKHDFALLKLQQAIIRPQYFQLCPSLKQICKLAVTGYVHLYGNQTTLLTHSNTFKSINKERIDYEIDTKEGQSGCPVYKVDDSRKVVAIHKAYDPQKKLNFATLITQSVISALESWAQQMNASFGKLKENRTSNEQMNKLTKKGDNHRNLAQFEKAITCYEMALKIAQKTYGNESVEYATTIGRIGCVHLWERKYNQSLECFTRQLKIYEIIYKHQSIEKANVLINISIVQSKLNKQELAYNNYQSAVTIYKKIGTNYIQQCPYTLHNIGRMYDFQTKTSKALEYYNKAATIHEKTAKTSIGQAMTLRNIGYLYIHKNKFQQALKYYNKAVLIHAKIGRPSIDWANTLNNIGLVHYTQQKFKQALQYYDQAIKIHNKIESESIGLSYALNNIGDLHLYQGKFQQSLQYYYKAMTIHEKKGTKSMGWANTLNNISLVYKNQGLDKQYSYFLKKSQQMKHSLK